MNKKEIRIIILGLLLFCFITFLHSDFVDLGVGARQQGLGNCFVGICDDATSIYYNPAGLGYTKVGEVVLDYTKLYVGLDDNSDLSTSFVGIVYPVSFNIKNKKRNIGAAGIGLLTFSFEGVYKENTFIVSYGKRISNKISLGGNVKYLSESYQNNLYTLIDPVFDYGKRTSVSSLGLDVGGLYIVVPRLFLGVSLINLNQPSVGLLSSNEKLPVIMKVGAGYREKKLNAGLEINFSEGYYSINSGLEYLLLKGLLYLRGGIEIGSKEANKISFGTSFVREPVRVDYAFSFPLSGIKDISGSHKVSIIVKFGKIPKDEIEPGSLEEAYLNLEEETKKLKEELEKTEQERKKLEEALINDAVIKAKERIKELKTSPVPTERRETVTSPQPTTTEVKYHVVGKEDTLQSLAQKYYGDPTKWMEIYNANKEKIGRGGSLVIGQTLLITPLTSRAVPVETRPLIQKTEPSVIQPRPTETQALQPSSRGTRTYTVQQGDTLFSIAEKYYSDRTQWKKIYEANKDKIVGGRIEPGQVLIIP